MSDVNDESLRSPIEMNEEVLANAVEALMPKHTAGISSFEKVDEILQCVPVRETCRGIAELSWNRFKFSDRTLAAVSGAFSIQLASRILHWSGEPGKRDKTLLIEESIRQVLHFGNPDVDFENAPPGRVGFFLEMYCAPQIEVSQKDRRVELLRTIMILRLHQSPKYIKFSELFLTRVGIPLESFGSDAVRALNIMRSCGGYLELDRKSVSDGLDRYKIRQLLKNVAITANEHCQRYREINAKYTDSSPCVTPISKQIGALLPSQCISSLEQYPVVRFEANSKSIYIAPSTELMYRACTFEGFKWKLFSVTSDSEDTLRSEISSLYGDINEEFLESFLTSVEKFHSSEFKLTPIRSTKVSAQGKKISDFILESENYIVIVECKTFGFSIEASTQYDDYVSRLIRTQTAVNQIQDTIDMFELADRPGKEIVGVVISEHPNRFIGFDVMTGTQKDAPFPTVVTNFGEFMTMIINASFDEIFANLEHDRSNYMAFNREIMHRSHQIMDFANYINVDFGDTD